MLLKFIYVIYKLEVIFCCKLVIVGKGLIFDFGGLNLKVFGSGIEMMKIDMGGVGIIFGIIKVIV